MFRHFILIFFLTSCSTIIDGSSSTPYQTLEEMHMYGGGYSDIKIEDGSFYVSFVGNGFTSHKKTEMLWHQHAKLLCNNGEYTFTLSHEKKINSIMLPEGGIYVLSSSTWPVVRGEVKCIF